MQAQYTPKEAGEYVAAWTARLASREAEARSLACESLREVADGLRSPTITILAGRVQSMASAQVQREAASAIANIGPVGKSNGVESILKGLDSADEEVRGAVIDALGALTPYSARALPELTALLKHKSPIIREKSKHALDRLRHPAKGLPETRLLENTTAVLDADASPSEARQKVELWTGQLIRSRDVNVNVLACQCLGTMGRQLRAAVPRLAKLMEKDPSPAVRRDAARTLAAIGPPAWHSCGQALIKALEDQNHSVRRAAIGAISVMAPLSESALPRLAEFIKDKNPDLRRASINALTTFGPGAKCAVPKLMEALKDPDKGVPGKVWSVRQWTLEVLIAIGPEAGGAAPAVWDLHKSADAETSRWALACLAKITPADRAVRQILIRNLADKDIALRLHAAGTMRFLGPYGKEAIPALLQTLKSEYDSKHREFLPQIRSHILVALPGIGASAVPAFIEAFSFDSLIRADKEDIINGLGKMGPAAREALPFLRDQAKQAPIPFIRLYASQAIKKIEKPK